MNTQKLLMLRTNRLNLVAATLDHVSAELESPERLARLLNVRVDHGWPPGEYDRSAQEFFRERLAEGGMAVIGWYGWYAIALEERRLVGAGGYFGPPAEEGTVEIGFSVMPAWRGRGYATEMAQALVANAFEDVHVQKVLAHAHPNNAASITVLTRSGFGLVGRDQESGTDLFHIVRSAEDESQRIT